MHHPADILLHIPVLSSQNYDGYYRQIKNIADEHGVEFYDFNLCKSEYLDVMHSDYFSDNGHLNEVGSNIFTPVMWDICNRSYETVADYFCDSYKEKIELDNPQLYGIYYVDGENGKECTFASNTDTELEYAIVYLPDDATEEVVRDYSVEKEFVLPNDVNEGKYIARARLINTNEVVSSFEILCGER